MFHNCRLGQACTVSVKVGKKSRDLGKMGRSVGYGDGQSSRTALTPDINFFGRPSHHDLSVLDSCTCPYRSGYPPQTGVVVNTDQIYPSAELMDPVTTYGEIS